MMRNTQNRRTGTITEVFQNDSNDNIGERFNDAFDSLIAQTTPRGPGYRLGSRTDTPSTTTTMDVPAPTTTTTTTTTTINTPVPTEPTTNTISNHIRPNDSIPRNIESNNIDPVNMPSIENTNISQQLEAMANLRKQREALTNLQPPKVTSREVQSTQGSNNNTVTGHDTPAASDNIQDPGLREAIQQNEESQRRVAEHIEGIQEHAARLGENVTTLQHTLERIDSLIAATGAWAVAHPYQATTVGLITGIGLLTLGSRFNLVGRIARSLLGGATAGTLLPTALGRNLFNIDQPQNNQGNPNNNNNAQPLINPQHALAPYIPNNILGIGADIVAFLHFFRRRR